MSTKSPAVLDDQKIGSELSFAATEAYNLLRTNLYFSVPSENGRGIVIGTTSACPQEGKSYTSINLAYTLAKDGKKTLLVDADMRRPSVERKLKLSSPYGLSTLLSRQGEVEFFKSELNENLSICLAGNTPPNPSELIGSSVMQELVEKWRTEFDVVILDLPPVNTVTDGLLVSKYIDGLMVAVRHGFSRKKDLLECIRKLKFAKAHIIGIVYRGYTHKASSYYRRHKYYSYKKYYSYYTSDNTKTSNTETTKDNEKSKK